MQVLDRPRIAERQLVGSDAHDVTVILVQCRKPFVAFAWGSMVEVNPFCELGSPRARELSKWMEEQTVQCDAQAEYSKVDGQEEQGLYCRFHIRRGEVLYKKCPEAA